MARPRLITDEQIIEAAREVFLEHGFSATTAEIAQRAGVSEGTLFKRFFSKEELFEAAIGLVDYQVWREDLLNVVGNGDVRRNLENGIMSFLKAAERIIPILMTVFSRGHDPSHNPLLKRLENPASQDASAIVQYLNAEMKLGRIRPLDADITARIMIGSLTHYIHQEHIVGAEKVGEVMAPERFVRGMMDVLWPGMAP